MRQMLHMALLACSAAAFSLVAAVTIPTVEIAPGVHMPRVQLGCCTHNVSASLPYFLQLQPQMAAIDTAYGYKDQEQIAHVLAQSGRSRSSVWLTSKVPGGLVKNGGPCTAADPRAAAIAMVQADLAQLNVSFIDLMLLHEPCDMKTFQPTKQDLAIWQGLVECLARGYVRAIGVDRMVPRQVAPLLAIHKPSVLMASMNIGGRAVAPPPKPLPIALAARGVPVCSAACSCNEIEERNRGQEAGWLMGDPRTTRRPSRTARRTASTTTRSEWRKTAPSAVPPWLGWRPSTA
jgi:aryl-alcohol dehydrogenase-like predicted oxidoreductase